MSLSPVYTPKSAILPWGSQYEPLRMGSYVDYLNDETFYIKGDPPYAEAFLGFPLFSFPEDIFWKFYTSRKKIQVTFTSKMGDVITSPKITKDPSFYSWILRDGPISPANLFFDSKYSKEWTSMYEPFYSFDMKNAGRTDAGGFFSGENYDFQSFISRHGDGLYAPDKNKVYIPFNMAAYVGYPGEDGATSSVYIGDASNGSAKSVDCSLKVGEFTTHLQQPRGRGNLVAYLVNNSESYKYVSDILIEVFYDV